MSVYKSKFSFSVLLCVLLLLFDTRAEDICHKCNIHSPASIIVEYCTNQNQTGDLILSNSCCKNKTISNNLDVIGIDLSNCSLTSVEGFFIGFTHLKLILLQGNNNLKIKAGDFIGLQHLEYLSLPKGLQCPGGKESWNNTDNTEDAVVCLDEVNLCNNVLCPNSNSFCLMKEPGDMECQCKEGYHGYKCLRQGYFPTVMFIVALCSCTIVLSGYLWCIQRRKVKTQ